MENFILVILILFGLAILVGKSASKLIQPGAKKFTDVVYFIVFLLLTIVCLVFAINMRFI